MQDTLQLFDKECKKDKKNQMVQTFPKPKRKSDLSVKEGSLFVLFCTDEIHRTGMLQSTFLVSLESSRGGGVHGLGFIALGLA
jgi:hypothetical protein